jgi:hypothetical protein
VGIDRENSLNRKLGLVSSSALMIAGIAYLVVVGFGIAQAGLTEPIRDPVLAVMEAMTLVAGLLIVVVLAAVYGLADHDRKPLALIALSFGLIMAALTSAVHFVALTAGRQTGFTVLEWPSTLYALELLAWDVFLGLALLFAAAVFVGPGVRKVARWSLAVAGALCLLGTIGPVIGDMAVQRIGVLGYGVGLPVASLAVAVVFYRVADADPG